MAAPAWSDIYKTGKNNPTYDADTSSSSDSDVKPGTSSYRGHGTPGSSGLSRYGVFSHHGRNSQGLDYPIQPGPSSVTSSGYQNPPSPVPSSVYTRDVSPSASSAYRGSRVAPEGQSLRRGESQESLGHSSCRSGNGARRSALEGQRLRRGESRESLGHSSCRSGNGANRLDRGSGTSEGPYRIADNSRPQFAEGRRSGRDSETPRRVTQYPPSVRSRDRIDSITSRLERELQKARQLEADDEDTWPYVDYSISSDATPSLHECQSYGELGGASSTTSSSRLSPGRRNSPAPSSSTGRQDKRLRKKRRSDFSDETCTSGYSTNSVSELSDFNSHIRDKRTRSYPNALEVPRGREYGRDRDDKGTRSSGVSSRRDSNLSTVESRLSTSRRSDSNLSITDSSDITRVSNNERTRKGDRNKRPSSQSSEQKTQKQTEGPRGTVAVTVTNIQYDPNDPFAFIQPIQLPFHVRLRKCLGPIAAILLLLILAASLGAAIYFAVALKETQEKTIEFLKANLGVKIRHAGYVQDLNELSSDDFEFLASTYCRRMDDFYGESRFRDTYRGCEVISIENRYINFTLYFKDKQASSRDIMAVLETTAPKKKEEDKTVALVDKFEIELDSVKIKLEHKREPETFNKKTPKSESELNPIVTTSKPQREVAAAVATSKTVPPNSVETTTRKHTTTTTTERPTTTTTKKPTTSKKKVTAPADGRPVYAWNPCTEYQGTYFPHPVHCDWFIQCTNDRSQVQKCSPGLLYDWKTFTCVSKFTPGIECPDPDKAPPMPTTVKTTTVRTTTLKMTTTRTTQRTTPPPAPPAPTMPTRSAPKPRKEPEPLGNLTAIAGKYVGRPVYPENPCKEESHHGGIFPHPDDCSKFIQCVNSKAQKMACAPKLVFEPETKACRLPKDLICLDIAPCKDLDDGYFPHPVNCSMFIQCQFRKEKILSCQNGLVWSTAINSCVHKTAETKCPGES